MSKSLLQLLRIRIHGRRLLLSRLHNSKLAVDKLLNVLASRYQDRKGGYSRIIKFSTRKIDCASMAVIELVNRDIAARGKVYSKNREGGKVVTQS
jgi:large subunit ribosomal protein L17